MLLDTSGLLCCFDADEARHREAVRCYDGAVLRLTHNYVLAEFIALAKARRLPRDESLAFAADVLADPDVDLVWIDPLIHD
jgi:predicted nucleic acid-binding protein